MTKKAKHLSISNTVSPPPAYTGGNLEAFATSDNSGYVACSFFSTCLRMLFQGIYTYSIKEL